MKVISLWQPWASLIVYGHKAVETRDWSTNVRGRVLIHATKTEDKSDRQRIIQDEHFLSAFRKMNDPKVANHSGEFYDRLPRGRIVGTAELYDCVTSESLWELLASGYRFKLSREEEAFGNFVPERYGWLLRDPVLFKTPIPAKGKQGWWDFDLNLCSCGQPVETGIRHCTECQFSAVGCI